MLSENVKQRLLEAAKKFTPDGAADGPVEPRAAQLGAAQKAIESWVGEAFKIDVGPSVLPLPTGAEEKRDVLLPGNGRSITAFAQDLGQRMGGIGAMFRRHSDGQVMHIDPMVRFRAVSSDALGTVVEKTVSTVKLKRQGSGDDAKVDLEPTTMSKDTAKAVLECDAFLRELPVVTATSKIHLPHAGTARIELRGPGYYADTGLLVLPAALGPFDEMTLEQARDVLDGFFCDFPFGDDGRSLAVHLAAMLTMFCRQMLPAGSTVPIFAYTANSQRVGKTLLVKTAIAPRFETTVVETISKDPEELRKVLDAAALAGRAYIVLDNVKHKIDAAALEAFTTTSSWGGRILSKSESFEAPHECVVFITANAAQVSTDLDNRCLYVNLWIPEADPQARATPKRIYDDAYLARADVRHLLLSALWALVRNWAERGRPAPTGGVKGFEQWCAIIAGMVEAAGYHSPLARPDNLDVDPDPRSAGMKDLVAALADRRPVDQRGFEFAEMLDVCRELGLLDVPPLKDGQIDPRTRSNMGKLFVGYQGRQFAMSDGRVIRFGRRGSKNSRWWSVEVLANGGKVQ
jgi:hypothetical protein